MAEPVINVKIIRASNFFIPTSFSCLKGRSPSLYCRHSTQHPRQKLSDKAQHCCQKILTTVSQFGRPKERFHPA
jgi:hypothetical protein